MYIVRSCTATGKIPYVHTLRMYCQNANCSFYLYGGLVQTGADVRCLRANVEIKGHKV